MKIEKAELQKIFEMAIFLDDKGYAREIKEDAIFYSNNRIKIMIAYERYSDISDISIKFTDENEVYSVGWIACVRGGLSIDPHQRLDNVLLLLSYMKENYSKVTDIEYCRESNGLVAEYIDKLQKKG